MTTSSPSSTVDAGAAGGHPPVATASVRRQVGMSLALGGGLVGAGIAVGVVWALIAPVVTLTWSDFGYEVRWSDPGYQLGRFFVAEGELGALGLLAGLVAAILSRRAVRELGWPVVAALAVGGAVASVVAWRVGVWLGPDQIDVATLTVGDAVGQPLRLRSTGILLVWPMVAVFAALWIAMSGPDPERVDLPPADPAELASWSQSRSART